MLHQMHRTLQNQNMEAGGADDAYNVVNAAGEVLYGIASDFWDPHAAQDATPLGPEGTSNKFLLCD